MACLDYNMLLPGESWLCCARENKKEELLQLRVVTLLKRCCFFNPGSKTPIRGCKGSAHLLVRKNS